MGSGPLTSGPTGRARTRGAIGGCRQAGFGNCRAGRHQQSEGRQVEEALLRNGFERTGEGRTSTGTYATHHVGEGAGSGSQDHTGKPANATQWSTRTMAEAAGLSEKSVRRIWHKHGLKPHLSRTFKVSNDPEFAEKLEAIVGLYLNPPEHAIVLCADEKSQIQALDRTQPGLPIKKGRCGTMTHDYKRNGTATLFAAMNTLDGTVISMCDDRHRHQEWLKFLRVIDDVTPSGREIHLIADNYATHKHPKVQKWLVRHPRFHVYFTPTSSSWLNMVERFFRDLTQNQLRRGIFRDVEELIMAIGEYIDKHNDKPKPFVWTAKAADILEKVKRARKALDIG